MSQEILRDYTSGKEYTNPDFRLDEVLKNAKTWTNRFWSRFKGNCWCNFKWPAIWRISELIRNPLNLFPSKDDKDFLILYLKFKFRKTRSYNVHYVLMYSRGFPALNFQLYKKSSRKVWSVPFFVGHINLSMI